MSAFLEPFIITYCGVSIRVTPVNSDAKTSFMVELPTRNMFIETHFDPDEIHYWVEVPGNRTKVAEEIGELIEKAQS